MCDGNRVHKGSLVGQTDRWRQRSRAFPAGLRLGRRRAIPGGIFQGRLVRGHAHYSSQPHGDCGTSIQFNSVLGVVDSC